jgi:hypothetical protein
MSLIPRPDRPRLVLVRGKPCKLISSIFFFNPMVRAGYNMDVHCRSLLGVEELAGKTPAFLAGTARLCCAVLLSSVVTLAHAEDRMHFDLVCRGWTQETIREPPASSTAETIRLRVDLEADKFCIDAYCDSFSIVDDRYLEYHCRAPVNGQFCRAAGYWSAMLVSLDEDDFRVDRVAGTFERTSKGTGGDLVPLSVSLSFTGNCDLLPFTGLSPNRSR